MLTNTKAQKSTMQYFTGSRLFLAVIILFIIFVRVRLLDIPLERDEGEYAYMGQLILQGIPPYSEAYNMKFPGTYLMYAGIMAVFGQTIQGIHIGLLLVNCAAILLVYLLARKVMDDFPAAIAGGTYALLSLSSSVLGFAAHATHFVILPALGGVLLLLYAIERERLHLYFLSGTLLGISFITKQPGIFFVLFGATWILWQHLSSRWSGSRDNNQSAYPVGTLVLKLGTFSLGAALPLMITLVWLYFVGVFDRFWFWTVVYASKYAAQVPFSKAFSIFGKELTVVVDGFFLFWMFAALGLIAIFFDKGLKTNRAFVILFALSSFLSICPGFYFRRHYFVTLLPATSLLSGMFTDFLMSGRFSLFRSQLSKYAIGGIFIAAAAVGVIRQKDYLFTEDPVRLSGLIYAGNPFSESIRIAKFVEARTTSDDRIAVFGSEPQIFFYAKRQSATGYIYVYNLMEIHEYALPMQKEMTAEVESAKPKFLIDVRSSASWLVREGSEAYIFEWLKNYIANNYNLIGIADIMPPDQTVYKWYDEVKDYRIHSPAYVLIFQRR